MSQRSEQVSLFAALNAASVEYAVVGGVAVNAHGFIRNTRDLDIFFRPTLANSQALFSALETMGAPLDGVDPSDLLADDEQFQLSTPENRFDFLPFIGEMSFDQVWRNRVAADIDGVTIHFISKADLIENKRQVGRHIDLADVEELSRLSVPRDPGLGLDEDDRDQSPPKASKE